MTKLPLLVGAVLLAGATAVWAQSPPPPPGPPPAESGPTGRPWMGMHHHPMMMQKAAMFRFRRDGAEISIKCAADEPTKACVEAASLLIDKVMAAPAK